VEDTLSIYERIAAEQSIEKKREIFKNELMMPYDGMLRAWLSIMHAADPMKLLEGWSFLMPDGIDEKVLDSLRTLEKCHAWELSRQTLVDVRALFDGRWDRIGLKHIRAGIFLLDRAKMNPSDRGYTGVGGNPGYVMQLYGEPNAYNMARIQATLAHEIHHNVRLSLFPWSNPMELTVAEHVLMEGMAEAFATELYGEDKVGYYVTDTRAEDIPRAREIIKQGLGVKGFMKTRAYLYGDRMAQFGGEKIGMPDNAGFTIGYYAAKSYLKETGKSIVEATFAPAMEIARESKYFE
jgi:uncharacterized protein YjaZ